MMKDDDYWNYGFKRDMPFNCDDGMGYFIKECDEHRIVFSAKYFNEYVRCVPETERDSQPLREFNYKMEHDGYSECVRMDEGRFYMRFRNPNWMMDGYGDMDHGDWSTGAK